VQFRYKWLDVIALGKEAPELAPYSGDLCPPSVEVDGAWYNGAPEFLCPSPSPYFVEDTKYVPTLDGTTTTTKPQCKYNPDCIIRIEDCSKDASKQECESYFTNVYAIAGNTKASIAKGLCQMCQFSETYASGTTGKPYTFSSKESRVAEGSKAWPAMATNCMASADKTNGMCAAEVAAAQSRQTAQTRAIENMPSYPPSSPPPAGNDFCDKYQADGKINGMPTCVTSDNDGNPCCTQIGNQRCQYGYCLRSVG
jgi:hypothetical protein